MQLDTVIFGGGAAGLWLLDELVRREHNAVLLEAGELGQGQTIAAQGIIHGGLKYTLRGLLTASATSIREMPHIWRACLAGQREPDLSRVRIRSQCCYLWRTESLISRLGMIGAKFGLHVAPITLSRADRPAVLASCPGTVARLDEQIVAPDSLITRLFERHRDRILKIDCENGLEFDVDEPGRVKAIRLPDLASGTDLELNPKSVIFTAGSGNGKLRECVGLSETEMQNRPLHMVMVRGPLPPFNGHCVDGSSTRVTITSDTDTHGRTVWQLGGQIAEDGVKLDQPTLIRWAHAELSAVMPDVDLADAEWTTYRVDRAERTMPDGKRPETVQWTQQGNCISAWPTKLAFVPQLANEIASHLSGLEKTSLFNFDIIAGWPRPRVAQPPWECVTGWQRESTFAVRKAA